MIYLDYSASTPMSLESLDTYCNVVKENVGGINSNNPIGANAKKLLSDTTKSIGNMFNILPEEIIYTTGAVEANNMAIIGVALANHKYGKHIITSKLENNTVYNICKYLESIGFEISYVKNDNDGLISFDDLKDLIRPDTILVSISAVNSEVGVRQPLKMLRQIIKKENEHTIFHSDLSEALGKTIINFRDVDLGSVSSSKIYGPYGIGFLYKNINVKLAPLYGNRNMERKDLSLPLIVSMKESLKQAIKGLDKKERYVNLLNERMVSKLEKLAGIKINKTKYSIPHILNISLDDVLSETMISTLANNDIFVSGNNNDEISAGVMALYNDLERSKRTIRISISHLTTVLETNSFLEIFEREYSKLSKLTGK